jgi:hypothetical protein
MVVSLPISLPRTSEVTMGPNRGEVSRTAPNDWGAPRDRAGHVAMLFFCAATIASCSDAPPSGAFAGAAGGGPTAPSRVSAEGHRVKVTRVRVFMKDGRPQAYVEGELGDGCTFLESLSQRRSGNTFTLTVTAVRQGDVCTQQMQYLDAWVALDGAFVPGAYRVRANDAAIRVDLVAGPGGELRVEPDPGPLPQFPEPPHVPGVVSPNEPPVVPNPRAISPAREPRRS